MCVVVIEYATMWSFYANNLSSPCWISLQKNVYSPIKVWPPIMQVPAWVLLNRSFEVREWGYLFLVKESHTYLIFAYPDWPQKSTGSLENEIWLCQDFIFISWQKGNWNVLYFYFTHRPIKNWHQKDLRSIWSQTYLA